MAYKCLFMDNGVYTAQDVNDAFSNIISGGVSGYPLGLNAVADLNGAIAELVSGGVNYHGTDCLGNPALFANHFTHIVFSYMELKNHCLRPFGFRNADLFGMLHQRLCHKG